MLECEALEADDNNETIKRQSKNEISVKQVSEITAKLKKTQYIKTYNANRFVNISRRISINHKVKKAVESYAM